MDSGFEDHAYQDKAFPIAAGQTISQPYTVAFQSELLEVKKGDKVLEVGTGSGYQTAVLCELGAKVYSIERQRELFKKTKLFLSKLGYWPKHLSFGVRCYILLPLAHTALLSGTQIQYQPPVPCPPFSPLIAHFERQRYTAGI